MKPTIVPFVKWVGGKRQIIDEILSRIPIEFNTYFEPFVGGGAIFLKLQPPRAMISDINFELINAFQTIKRNPHTLHEILLVMQMANSADFYQKVRVVDSKSPANDDKEQVKQERKLSPLFRAARFIYLNKTCFNGIYRVNSSGKFNVPFGHRKNVVTHSYTNLVHLSNYLRQNKVKIRHQDFVAIKRHVKAGDFVYFDPPYDYENERGFDSYSSNKFGTVGQQRLVDLCHWLDQNGVKFMLSNHNTPFIRNAYKKFNIDVINVWRLVGGKNSKRSKVEEVIITNYEC